MQKQSFGPELGPITQVAFVVDDLERAMEQWTRVCRVGPFFHFAHFPLIEVVYRGTPTSIDIDVALAFSGAMCFELIRQNDDRPSPFRESVSGSFSLHHVAVTTREFDAALEQQVRNGFTLVGSAKVAAGARSAYLESAEASPFIELIESTPEVEQFFGGIRAAAESWDGSDPVRGFG